MAGKLRKVVLGVFAIAMSLGVFGVFSRPVFAAESNKPIHLQIAPTKQKLKLEPGQSFVSSIKVMNIGTKKFDYSVSASPYSVVDENYNADYENFSNDFSKVYNWITFDEKLKSGTLEPKTAIDVPFTITVPKTAAPGGQYAAIMAQTSDGNDANAAIQIVNRLGMILYVNVAGGKVCVEGEIIKNNINTFLFEPPISATSLVESEKDTNVETTATYIMKVWPLGSSETVFNNEETPVKLDIIPQTRRFNSITWEGAPKLGIFTVEQTIEYLGQKSTVKKLVIICPFWLLLIIIIAVVVLIGWLVFRIIKRKKAKKEVDDNKERRI